MTKLYTLDIRIKNDNYLDLKMHSDSREALEAGFTAWYMGVCIKWDFDHDDFDHNPYDFWKMLMNEGRLNVTSESTKQLVTSYELSAMSPIITVIYDNPTWEWEQQNIIEVDGIHHSQQPGDE